MMNDKPTKATGPKGVNWPALRTEYVASDGLTLRELAASHGIPEGTIFRRAAQGNPTWSRQRLARQEADASAALEKLRVKLRGELVERTEQHLLALRGGLAHLIDRLARGVHVVVGVEDEDGEKRGVTVRAPLDPKTSDAVVRAIVEAIKQERVILGEVEGRTETQFSEQQLERLAARMTEALRGEGDAAEVAARLREVHLTLLREDVG